VQTSTGNAVNSELAHLYYITLGNLSCVDTAGKAPVTGCGLTNTAYFQNFKDYDYWSGTVYALYSGQAWYFRNQGSFTNAGVQHIYDKRNLLYAVAVQSGDVLPTPSTATLILVALGVMTLTRCKRPN
jgi:hypothetical protein